MGLPPRRALLAVLANPPLGEGTRTVRRVEQAALALGYAEVDISNLFSIPSRATSCIADLGVSEMGWLGAQADISAKLTAATAVLLAYGSTAPAGAARRHFHTQVAWLHRQLAELALPVWWFGDGPRHPSRWQRWTQRVHPDLAFHDALARGLVPATLKLSGAPARLVPSRGQHGPSERAEVLG